MNRASPGPLEPGLSAGIPDLFTASTGFGRENGLVSDSPVAVTAAIAELIEAYQVLRQRILVNEATLTVIGYTSETPIEH